MKELSKLSPNDERYEELWLLILVNENIMPNGTIHREVKWIKAEEDLNLGSIKNPQNQDIIAIEYRSNKPSRNPFGLFKL